MEVLHIDKVAPFCCTCVVCKRAFHTSPQFLELDTVAPTPTLTSGVSADIKPKFACPSMRAYNVHGPRGWSGSLLMRFSSAYLPLAGRGRTFLLLRGNT